jgi:hypothetical protein
VRMAIVPLVFGMVEKDIDLGRAVDFSSVPG